MTVPSTSRSAGPFNGNASTTTFPFTFKVFDKTNIQVVKVSTTGVQTTLTLDSDYSVAVNADQVASPGGTVTYPISGSPLAVGETLSITGALVYSQTTSLAGGGNFSPTVIEQTFDRIVILAQQLYEKVSRAIRFPASDSGNTSVLPVSSLRANKALIFDASGNVGVSVDNYVDQLANVTAQASSASASAASASSSASSASASASSASSSATSAAASLADLKNRYMGAYAADPTTRPDSTALQQGDAYFNSTSKLFMVYNGATFQASDINTANLAASTGATLVGSNDGASGSLWTTVAGFTAKTISSAGSSVVGFIQSGTGAVARFVQDKLRETVSVTDYGAATGTAASQSSKFQAAIDAMAANGGGNVDVPAGTWRLDTQVTVKSSVRLRLNQFATIVHGANANLFRMKPRSRFEGGKVDTSSTSLASFSSVVFEFDGTDSSPSFRGVEPTVVQTEVVGRRGVGTGTAFSLHATGAPASIYGVQLDSTIDGFELGVLMQNDDSGSNNRWVNGNHIKVRGIATVNFIKQVTGVDGTGIDGNVYEFDYQTDVTNTSTVIQVVGRYNTLRGMIWDYAQVPAAITFSAGSSRNALSLHGPQTSKITDSGAANTIFTYTDGNPALKVSALGTNSAATLNIVGNDVVLSNNKNLQWKDSGGTTRTLVLLTSADNVQFGTSALNNTLFSAATKHEFLIGATENMRVDGSTTAGDTRLLLWDVNKGTLSRVSVGANDSGGTGFKVLRVPN